MAEISCLVVAKGWSGPSLGGDGPRQSPGRWVGVRNAATFSYPIDVTVTPDGQPPLTHKAGWACWLWQGSVSATEAAKQATVDSTAHRYLTAWLSGASRLYLVRQQDFATIAATNTIARVDYIQDGTGYHRRAQPKRVATPALLALLAGTYHGHNTDTYAADDAPSDGTPAFPPLPWSDTRNTPPGSFFTGPLSGNRMALDGAGRLLVVAPDGRLWFASGIGATPGLPVTLPGGSGQGLITAATTMQPFYDANSTLSAVAVGAGIAQFPDDSQVAFAAQNVPIPGGVAGTFAVSCDRSGTLYATATALDPADGNAWIATVTVANRRHESWAVGIGTVRGPAVPGRHLVQLPDGLQLALADDTNTPLAPTFAASFALPTGYSLTYAGLSSSFNPTNYYPPATVGIFGYVPPGSPSGGVGVSAWTNANTTGQVPAGPGYNPSMIVPSGTLSSSPAWANPLTYLRLSLNSQGDAYLLGVSGVVQTVANTIYQTPGFPQDSGGGFRGDPCTVVFSSLARPAGTNSTAEWYYPTITPFGRVTMSWGIVYETGPTMTVARHVTSTRYVLGVARDSTSRCWWALVEDCNVGIATANAHAEQGSISSVRFVGPPFATDAATATFYDGTAAGLQVTIDAGPGVVEYTPTYDAAPPHAAVVSVDRAGNFHSTTGANPPLDGTIPVAIAYGPGPGVTVYQTTAASLPVSDGSGHAFARTAALYKSTAASPLASTDWTLARTLASGLPASQDVLIGVGAGGSVLRCAPAAGTTAAFSLAVSGANLAIGAGSARVPLFSGLLAGSIISWPDGQSVPLPGANPFYLWVSRFTLGGFSTYFAVPSFGTAATLGAVPAGAVAIALVGITSGHVDFGATTYLFNDTWTYELADGTVFPLPDGITSTVLGSLLTIGYSRVRFSEGDAPGIAAAGIGNGGSLVDQAGQQDFVWGDAARAADSDGAGGIYALAGNEIRHRPGPVGTPWTQITTGYNPAESASVLRRHPTRAHTLALAYIVAGQGTSWPANDPPRVQVDLIDTLSGAVTPGVFCNFPDVYFSTLSMSWGMSSTVDGVGRVVDTTSDLFSAALPTP